jgi:hypothetical protein
MDTRVFRDKEIVWFYWIVTGGVGLTLLLMLTGQEWLYSILVGSILLAFLYLSWPLSAEVTDQGYLIFRYPIRKETITPTSLARVKAIGGRDYRAHIGLRNKWGLPIGYRCRKYTDHAQLAQAVLDLIAKAPHVKVTEDALKLLKQTAKGSTKPLPLK